METIITDVIAIIEEGRRKAYHAVNTSMVEAYWLAGKRIVEEEQNGQERAAYGKEVVKMLSKQLSASFGRGFSETNIRSFRLFYLTFPNQNQIQQTVSAKLSWSHFQLIMRVSDSKARAYYLKEAAEQNWDVRTLERNINTLYYHRLISSQDKRPVENEMLEKTGSLKQNPNDFIRNPAVLEFLNIPIPALLTNGGRTRCRD